MMFPVNMNQAHWVLVHVNFLLRKIVVYDSLLNQSKVVNKQNHRVSRDNAVQSVKKFICKPLCITESFYRPLFMQFNGGFPKEQFRRTVLGFNNAFGLSLPAMEYHNRIMVMIVVSMFANLPTALQVTKKWRTGYFLMCDNMSGTHLNHSNSL